MGFNNDSTKHILGEAQRHRNISESPTVRLPIGCIRHNCQITLPKPLFPLRLGLKICRYVEIGTE
jgi:hypothetical protein